MYFLGEIHWLSTWILSFSTVNVDLSSKKNLKNCEIEKFVPPQYLKNSRKFPGTKNYSRERSGTRFFGKPPYFQTMTQIIPMCDGQPLPLRWCWNYARQPHSVQYRHGPSIGCFQLRYQIPRYWQFPNNKMYYSNTEWHSKIGSFTCSKL